jgi:hypothetical protein
VPFSEGGYLGKGGYPCMAVMRDQLVGEGGRNNGCAVPEAALKKFDFGKWGTKRAEIRAAQGGSYGEDSGSGTRAAALRRGTGEAQGRARLYTVNFGRPLRPPHGAPALDYPPAAATIHPPLVISLGCFQSFGPLLRRPPRPETTQCTR